MNGGSRLLGLVAVAAGFGLTGYALGRYEAWWTIAIAIGAAAIGLSGTRLRPGQSLAIGLLAGGAIAIGILGALLLFMGMHGPARPCSPDVCTDSGPALLLGGAGAMLLAALALGIAVRVALRR